MMRQWLAHWLRTDKLQDEIVALRSRLAEYELGERLGSIHSIALESAARATANADALDALADRVSALESAEEAARQEQKKLGGELLSLERQVRLGESQAADANRTLLQRIDEMRRQTMPATGSAPL